jgi:hypothetical protein
LAADIVGITGREIGPFTNNFGPDGWNWGKKSIDFIDQFNKKLVYLEGQRLIFPEQF